LGVRFIDKLKNDNDLSSENLKECPIHVTNPGIQMQANQEGNAEYE